MTIIAFPCSSQQKIRLERQKKRERIDAEFDLCDAIMGQFAEWLIRDANSAHADVFISPHPELDPNIRDEQFPFGPTSIVGKHSRYSVAIRNMRCLVRRELELHCKRNNVTDPYNNNAPDYQIRNRHSYSYYARKAIDALEHAELLWKQHLNPAYLPVGA